MVYILLTCGVLAGVAPQGFLRRLPLSVYVAVLRLCHLSNLVCAVGLLYQMTLELCFQLVCCAVYQMGGQRIPCSNSPIVGALLVFCCRMFWKV